MVSVDDRATGPHSSESRAADHERLVLEPRDVEFDWTNLPFHYVPNEPMATHVLNVLHMLLPAGEEFFVRVLQEDAAADQGRSTEAGRARIHRSGGDAFPGALRRG